MIRDKILRMLAGWHASHPWRMLGAVILITLVLGMCASQLTVTMRTQDLLPEGDPKVDQFNIILDEFKSATSIIVIAQGPEKSIKAFADDIAPKIKMIVDSSHNKQFGEELVRLQKRLSKLEERNHDGYKIEELESDIAYARRRLNIPLFQRVDYKIETSFIKNHGLLLVKAEDLESTGEMFQDPNIIGLIENLNAALEKEYVGQEESISTREKEDGAFMFLDGIQTFAGTLSESIDRSDIEQAKVHQSVDKFLFGEPYLLSYDKSTLLLNVIPNFSIMERDLIMVAAESLQQLVDDTIKDYPDVTAGLTGDIAREYDEQTYSEKSLSYTTLIAFAAILIMLVIAFRMLVAPVFAMITLFVGLLWALGAAFLAVTQLNMMTAMLSIVLLGLGIDFSIHIISGFTEWRASGSSIHESLVNTFVKSGKGVITGALTTACAFLALVISQSRGMKEMGIVTALGLLSILLATFLLLPLMLVFRERYLEKRLKKKRKSSGRIQRDITLKWLGNWGVALSRRFRLTFIVTLLISIFLVYCSSSLVKTMHFSARLSVLQKLSYLDHKLESRRKVNWIIVIQVILLLV